MNTIDNNRIVISSPQALARFCERTMPALWERGKYIVVVWEFGAPASNAQKALLKIWIRKIAAHLLKKREKDVSKDEMESMTRGIKKRYYTVTGEPFMVKQEGAPLHPDRKEVEVTSSKDWTQGECTRVMDWLQATAATEYDLILESTGEHRDIKHSNNR